MKTYYFLSASKEFSLDGIRWSSVTQPFTERTDSYVIFDPENGENAVTIYPAEATIYIDGVKRDPGYFATTLDLKNTINTVFPKANPGSGGPGTATTDASQLTTGTLSDARLSSNVAKNFTPTTIKTAAYTAAANQLVKTDATGGNVPITLPASQPDKTRIAVKMIAVSGNNVTTITTSATDVLNKAAGSTSISLTLVNQAATFQYEAATGIWSVLSSDVPLSGLDLRFASKNQLAAKTAGIGALPAFATDATEIAASAYDPILTTAANSGNAQNLYVLNNANKSRIRQTGSITKIQMYFASKPAQLTAFYFYVWRKNAAGTFDMVGSEDILSKITGGTTNTITLTTPIAAKEGDYTGYGIAGTAAPVNFMTGYTSVTSGGYYNAVAPTATGYNWTGQSTVTSYVPIKVFMAAPALVSISDSIMAGHPMHSPYINTAIAEDLGNTAPYIIEQLLSISAQNMGVQGEQTYSLVARFASDVVASKPKMVLIEGGLNDAAGFDVHGAATNGSNPVTAQTTIDNIISMMNTANTNGITPVVLLLTPWTAGTNAQNTSVDSINAAIIAAAPTYNAIVVDARATIGQFRNGGTAGNLWDIQPQYNYDGIHLSAAGKYAVANLIASRIAANYTQVAGATVSATAPARVDQSGNAVFPAVNAATLSAGFANQFSVGINGKINFDYTNTPVTTTGAQTINKPSGSVNLAAGATSLIVTNSLVSATSHVFVTVETTDANNFHLRVVPNNGFFTIAVVGTAPAGVTKVGFLVIN